VTITPADAKIRLRDIIAEKSLSHGDFKLASGASSGYYFDMKPTMLDPDGSGLIADLILDALEGENVDCVGGLAYGAIPLVVAVVQRSARRGRPLPGFYVRKEQKDRGAERLIDGNLIEGGVAVVLEDVTTKGGSSLKAVTAVREAGCEVNRVIAVVDRLEGAEATLRENDLKLTALLTRADFGG
jgi:orotate phosphoribosyltransferase